MQEGPQPLGQTHPSKDRGIPSLLEEKNTTSLGRTLLDTGREMKAGDTGSSIQALVGLNSVS